MDLGDWREPWDTGGYIEGLAEDGESGHRGMVGMACGHMRVATLTLQDGGRHGGRAGVDIWRCGWAKMTWVAGGLEGWLWTFVGCLATLENGWGQQRMVPGWMG